MYTPWHGKTPKESKWHQFFIFGLVIFAIVTMLILSYSVFYSRDPHPLWNIVAYFAPAGLIFFVIYLRVKEEFEKRRLHALADVLLKATYYLRKDPPTVVEFDNKLSVYLLNVLKGPESLFILSLSRYLEHLRLIIVRENQLFELNEGSTKLIFPYKELSSSFYKLSDAITKLDKTLAFDLVGEMLSLILKFRRMMDQEPLIEFSMPAFIDSCQSISGLLKIRLFLDADFECKELVKKVRLQNVDDLSTIGWQAVIVYWIWIRLSIIETALPLKESRFKLWVGPSRLLADQIDSIIIFYEQQDFDHIVQVIISSFDWNLRIPRFLLKEGLSNSQYNSFLPADKNGKP